jgi:hypothetical protein
VSLSVTVRHSGAIQILQSLKRRKKSDNLVLIRAEQVAGLDAEHIETFWRTQKLLTLSGVRSSGHQAYNVVAITTTLSLVSQITRQKEKNIEMGQKEKI